MAIYNGRILIRKGNEADFDPSKMMAGEWAVSLDKGIVRICLQAGKCIRMATYEAFEEDMQAVENVLLQCQSIEEAVRRINEEVSTKLNAVAEYVEQAKTYRDEAKAFRDEAEQLKNEAQAFTPEGYLELVGVATETKERVDDLEGNMETLSSEVETNKNNIEKVSYKVDTVIEKADLRIKETASGESIHLTDSADAKVVEFGLYGKATQKTTTGKNLLNLLNGKSGTDAGVTMTNRGDGSYTVTGTATSTIANIWFWGSWNITPKDDNSNVLLTLQKGKTYVIKDCCLFKGQAYYSSGIHTISEDFKVTGIRCEELENGKTYNEIIYPILYESDVDDGIWEPYTGGQPSPNPNYPQDVEVAGSSGNVAVKSSGKNLLKNTASSNTKNELTMTVNNDKSITVVGTPTVNTSFDIAGYWGDTVNKLPIEKGKVIVNGTGADSNVDIVIADGGSKSRTFNKNYIIDLETDTLINKVTLFRYNFKENISYNITLYPMIRACDENGNPIGDDTYEPYKDTSSIISTPNGLAGIEVSSGGNYTDESGQQWVCDEIVKYADGIGEYVQRVKEIAPKLNINNVVDASVYTGAKEINANYRVGLTDSKPYGAIMCNILESKTSNEIFSGDNTGCRLASNGIEFALPYEILGITKEATTDERKTAMVNYASTHEIYFLYELETPIRTPLTAEQIAEIEKLYTFYPVTNIYNDADCGMKVTYNVDAKRYIDNKIAELATAMINNI